MTDISRAGIIPFHKDTDGTIRMLFMIPSDREYGGTHPQIAKGRFDKKTDKSYMQCALREGQEELGFKAENTADMPFPIGVATIGGKHSQYDMIVYGAQVVSRTDFSTPHYETAETVWLTLEEFMVKGRRSHQVFVQRLCEALKAEYDDED